MSNASDFVIENGVLKKYNGSGSAVEVPLGVTVIGDQVFRGNETITSVVIPNSVELIGNDSFAECRNLECVVFPEKPPRCFMRPFIGCDKLCDADGFFIDRGTLYYYGGANAEVIIPAGVTCIGNSAFYGNKSITSVVIPDGVTTLDDAVFYACSNLSAVVLPDSVYSIGAWAFYLCKGLAEITFGSGLTTLGKEVFGWCGGLKKFTMPTCVGSVVSREVDGSNLRIQIPDLSALPPRLRVRAALCFAEEGGLTTDPRYESHIKYLKANAGKIMETAVENPALLSLICREGCIKAKDIEAYMAAAQMTGNTEVIAMVLDYQNNTLNTKQKEKAAKQKVKQEDTVFDRAVARRNQEGISGLNFVVTGDLYTFRNRNELKAFIESHGGKLQSSLSSKTDYLIMNPGSPDLTKTQKAKELGVEIIMENKFNEKAGRRFQIMDGELFKYIGSGTEVIIPGNVTYIHSYAFDEAHLTSVAIPHNVTKMDIFAFRRCRKLTHVRIGKAVESMNSSVFDDCGVTTVDILSGAQFIAQNAFAYSGELTTVSIPASVAEIGRTAFAQCPRLVQVKMEEGVKTIGDGAFLCNTQLKKITIPDSVTAIGEFVFRDCPELAQVTIGAGVTSIGGGAFLDCKSLQSVTIPDNVTYIGNSAFGRCDSLTEVTLGRSVTTLDKSAFRLCKNLSKITIPASVTTFGEFVFKDSPNVKIHAPKGSCAETYAKENNIPFVAE